jgi:hypothetical protein
MDDDRFQIAQRVLEILEMVEFRWTINEVLEQPQALLDDVIALRMIGNKIKTQRQAQQAKENG